MPPINKTELVWPGKYDEKGSLREPSRVHLPLQIVETVNESRATRESQGTIFDLFGEEKENSESSWRNKLIWGDNLLVMGSLLDNFAGKIDLIYIDPPFATGSDFAFDVRIGERKERIPKDASIMESIAYHDTWRDGLGSYLQSLQDRVHVMRELLCNTGILAVHVDYRVVHYVKVMLDGVFGSANFLNEVIWHYRSGGGGTAHFGRKHDTILLYTKTDNFFFDDNAPAARVPHDAVIAKSRQHLFDDRGKLRPDVWDISRPPNHSKEWEGYPTQKPLALLEVPVQVLSPPSGLVADFFCGSGTTLAVAEKLGRRWIGCDMGKHAIHTTRKRLLGIENCKPFEVLNLGKYESRYWQMVTFGDDK